MSSGIVFAALLAGHWVGDRWAQSDHQATGKGHTGWVGRKACASHVATLDPVLGDQQCPHPDCGEWYDPSDPDASYPHNNH